VESGFYFDSSTNKCEKRCSDKEQYNSTTQTCDCLNAFERYNGVCVLRCPANQIRVNGVCVDKEKQCAAVQAKMQRAAKIQLALKASNKHNGESCNKKDEQMPAYESDENIENNDLQQSSVENCDADHDKCKKGQIEVNGQCISDVQCGSGESKVNFGSGFQCEIDYCDNLKGQWYINRSSQKEEILGSEFDVARKYCGRFSFKNAKQNGSLKIKTDNSSFENHWVNNTGSTLHIYQSEKGFYQENTPSGNFEITNFLLNSH
jgi:hypothetical protein